MMTIDQACEAFKVLLQEQRSRIANMATEKTDFTRSEERRVGKECIGRCRSRWSPYH